MVAEALDIKRATYLAILLDHSYDSAIIMGSPIGGIDIEELMNTHPHQIFMVDWFYLT
jgi:succinyl-CoA synthetase beta subunit